LAITPLRGEELIEPREVQLRNAVFAASSTATISVCQSGRWSSLGARAT